MTDHIHSAFAFTLKCLRMALGWTQKRLADALGFSKQAITQYENGTSPLTRERLGALVEPLAPPEAVDVLLFAHELIFPKAEEEAPSPVALAPAERRSIDRAVMAAGRTAGQIAAENVRAELIHRRKKEKIEAALREADGLLERLLAVSREERVGLVEAFPDYWSWALAVRVCEASIRRAAHKAKEALELAELALFLAERSPGEESWRSRLKGYCWAHIANALRVGSDLEGADEAFARARGLWQAGAESDPGVLASYLLPAMEASLRRAQRRFGDALELLDRALEECQGEPLAAGRILLNRESAFNSKGDIQSAFEALRQAAPLVEASGDARLIFALRFNMADDLCHLERYGEAGELLPQVRAMAIQQANELDLVRIGWLEAKIAAGQDRPEEAMARLEQVRQDFTAREQPYNAALSSLDLAVLWLKARRTAEVRELAVAMGWIFKAQGIDREALAALAIFCDAARLEAATAELARRTIADIEQARRSASPQR